MSARLAWPCGVVWLLAACATSQPGAPAPVTMDDSVRAALEQEIARLEDRRDAVGRLESLAREGDPKIRARALWALGRIQDVRTTDTVLAALTAPDREVRDEAAFASGLLLQSWDGLPEAVEKKIVDALIAAEAAERSPEVRLRLLETLGKAPTASELVEARLRERLSDASPELAARAALSLGLVARRIQKLDERSVVAVLGALRADAPQPLRYGGAYALAFSKAPQARPALIACLEDADADVRALCARGLAEVGEPADAAALRPLLSDRSVRVAVEAVRALVKLVERCDPQSCDALEALRETKAWVAKLDAEPEWNQPLLAFAQAGLPARGAAVLSAVRGVVTAALGAQPGPDLAWLDCRFAAAQDRLQGSLLESLHCGAGQIPEDRRLSTALREIARTPMAEGTSRPTADWVPYLNHSSATLRNAALEALAASNAADAVAEIRALLGGEDPIVAGNAAYALAALGDRASVPAIRALVQRAPELPDLAPVADALADLVKPQDPKTPEEEVVQKALAKDVATELRTWLDSPHASVRASAASAILKLTGETLRPDVVPFPQFSGTSAEGTRLTFNRKEGVHAQPIPKTGAQLRFETTKGVFVVTLDPSEAPLTSANLFALAKRGYFDGLRFHRVVPDFVAQGGDPRGDGEGGPGYAIRCEIGHRTYARGAFGMALSGKDTGGSQFFVTTAPQPHLDGRYTHFGEVTSGMEVVDRLIEGDVMQKVTAVDGSGQAALARPEDHVSGPAL